MNVHDRKLLEVCLVIALAAALFAIASHACAITIPTGNYVMQAVGRQNVNDSVLSSPNVAGFHVRDSWDDIQPDYKNEFDWGFYDQQLIRGSRIHRFVTLGLYAGTSNDPSWGNSLTDFTNLVAAFGKRYDSNPLVTAVHLSAPQVTNNSMELYPPSSWHGTDAQRETIWERSIDAYSSAFPSKTLILDYAMGDTVAHVVAEYARRVLGARFEAIVCNLKADTNVNARHIQGLELLRSEGVRIGFEMVGPSTDTSRFGGSFQSAIAIGNKLGGSFYQVYQADVPKLTGPPKLTARLFAGGIPEPSTFIDLSIALVALSLRRHRR